jgi:hypothetical protein
MADKVIRLRWAAPCAGCGTTLHAGTQATWNTEAKAARCQLCPSGHGDTPGPLAEALTAKPPAVDTRSAGASARREARRRAERDRDRQQAAIDRDAAWRDDVHNRHPILGRIVTMTASKPPPVHETRHTKVWDQGAEGEERLGAVLDATVGIVPLHDRRIPRTKANIDHIAVGPRGVFVIDAKNYSGLVECRDVGGWFRSDQRLYVGGRDRTKLLEGVLWQVEQVREALGERDLPVYPSLCFTGPNWRRFFARPLSVRGVHIAWPSKVAEAASRPGPLTTDEIAATAAHLSAALAPA